MLKAGALWIMWKTLKKALNNLNKFIVIAIAFITSLLMGFIA